MEETLQRGVAKLVALMLAPGALVRAEPGWQDDLSAQAELTLGCTVAFLSHVVDREVHGIPLVMAKVHCVDKRVFDASRGEASLPFDFSPCLDASEGRSC
jgi:hypothetical protein